MLLQLLLLPSSPVVVHMRAVSRKVVAEIAVGVQKGIVVGGATKLVVVEPVSDAAVAVVVVA